ncbi:hypothetical protein BURK1_03487 [Burkholderiales bacterium]|nr:hypothetical protein BURK1_03487 [Burkholderiales bacterium]
MRWPPGRRARVRQSGGREDVRGCARRGVRPRDGAAAAHVFNLCGNHQGTSTRRCRLRARAHGHPGRPGATGHRGRRYRSRSAGRAGVGPRRREGLHRVRARPGARRSEDILARVRHLPAQARGDQPPPLAYRRGRRDDRPAICGVCARNVAKELVVIEDEEMCARSAMYSSVAWALPGRKGRVAGSSSPGSRPSGATRSPPRRHRSGSPPAPARESRGMRLRRGSGAGRACGSMSG